MHPYAGQIDPTSGYGTCYRHPDRVTGVRCIRCNRPICPECQRVASVGFQCPDDAAEGRRSIRRPRTAVGAPVSAAVPWVTWTMIALNVLVFVVTAAQVGGDIDDNSRSTLFYDWETVPMFVADNHQYYRLITGAFLHIGGAHILFNMIALFVIGPAVERVLGWWRYLAVYLLAALGGGVCVLLFGIVNGGVAGASAAIFGLFAAALVMSKTVGFDTRSLMITVAINVVLTFAVPGISILGHAGGFVVGGLSTLALMGWRLDGRATRLRTPSLQALSLAAIFVALVAASALRIASISAT